MAKNSVLIKAIREKAVRLKGAADAADEIISSVGDARFVLIGEASHGTHEFYQCRAAITKRLIAEKGFSAVAVEADFPDADRVNRFGRGAGADESAEQALRDFQKFPLWMWRNEDVLEFAEWLRDYNADKKSPAEHTGFYGIDLYSLHASIEAVLDFLRKVDPDAAKQAHSRYSCFDHFGEDAQSYGYAASYDERFSCEDEAVKQLVELQQRAAEYAQRDGRIDRDEYFFAEQNARLVKNAEEYYRQMFRGRVSSWNLRDRHMAETLDALAAHLEAGDAAAKIVVWAHNSHLGDARATEMGERGEWNVGQLVRERYGKDAVRIIGFTTNAGTVAAATDWGDAAQIKRVRPARKDSYEFIFHETELPAFFLDLRDEKINEELRRPQLERAIGVVYRPETERASHYFAARLSEQFDGIIHFDETTAVEPLEQAARLTNEDAPETYPTGL